MDVFESLGVARAEDARAAKLAALVGGGLGLIGLAVGIGAVLTAGSTAETVFGKEGSPSNPKADGLLLRQKAQEEKLATVSAKAESTASRLEEVRASVSSRLEALAAARTADKAELDALVNEVGATRSDLSTHQTILARLQELRKEAEERLDLLEGLALQQIQAPAAAPAAGAAAAKPAPQAPKPAPQAAPVVVDMGAMVPAAPAAGIP